MEDQQPLAKQVKLDMTLPADYQPQINPDQIEIVNDYFEKMETGPGPAVTSTLICRAEGCEVYQHCPLAKAKVKLPSGKPCPVEGELVNRWFQRLVKELEIDPDSIVDRAQSAELVRNWLLDKRVHEVLSDQKLIINSFRGKDEDGNVIFQEISNPLLFYFEKMHKVSDRILQSLIATREAKSKDKSRQVMSAAQLASGITARVEEMKLERQDRDRAMLRDAQGNIDDEINKRLDIIDVDVIDLD